MASLFCMGLVAGFMNVVKEFLFALADFLLYDCHLGFLATFVTVIPELHLYLKFFPLSLNSWCDKQTIRASFRLL